MNIHNLGISRNTTKQYVNQLIKQADDNLQKNKENLDRLELPDDSTVKTTPARQLFTSDVCCKADELISTYKEQGTCSISNEAPKEKDSTYSLARILARNSVFTGDEES